MLEIACAAAIFLISFVYLFHGESSFDRALREQGISKADFYATMREFDSVRKSDGQA